jgi:hypothetical protein
MISKRYYQELLSDTAGTRDRTKTETDLFSYIIDSEINGNFSQVRDFVNRLSQKQYNSFLVFLQDNGTAIKPCFFRGAN